MRRMLTVCVGSLIVSPFAHGESFENWLNAHFTSAERSSEQASPFLDPDGDGVMTIFEYFQGSDPKNAESLDVMSVQISGTNDEFRFYQSNQAEGLNPRVWSSLTLNGWDEFTGTLGTTTSANGVIYTATQTAREKRFFRMTLEPLTGYLFDSDSDGLGDFFEFNAFGDLSETASDNGDGDAYSNATEFILGSSPDQDFEAPATQESLFTLYIPNL